MESYKHKFAKSVLAGWLREVASGNNDAYVKLDPVNWRVNRGAPHFGVWEEYPIVLTEKNEVVGVNPVWDEVHDAMGVNFTQGVFYRDAPPTYEDLIALGHLPITIFDVAIQHKGLIVYGFEVVHRNDVSNVKMEYLERITRFYHLPVYRVSADWILSRCGRPARIECERII